MNWKIIIITITKIKNQDIENSNRQLLNELKNSIQQLSIKIETITVSSNQNRYKNDDIVTDEKSPLIEKETGKNNVMILDPPAYFLKREWCLGCVCCYTRACGCGCL